MRGNKDKQRPACHCVPLAERVPAAHRLRLIRRVVDQLLRGLPARFDTPRAGSGRPSIPASHLPRALLLPAFFPVR